jgi:predicted nuclease of restriction endonuclease-like (RecB) superfamily
MNNVQKTNRHELFDNIKNLLAEARKSIVRNINQTMVHTYFEIGRMIVEDEQKGKSKADYRERIIQDLSKKLTKKFGRGFSKRNLEQMRQFYNTYSINRTMYDQFTPIAQTMSAQSVELQNKHNGAYTAENKSLPTCNFVLSWSHYLKLMRIDDIAERHFYEIEAMNNNCTGNAIALCFSDWC